MQIISGGLDAWDALAYGEQNPNNLNYFKSHLQNIGDTLTDFGKQFYADAGAIYDRFNGSAAMQIVRNVTRAAKTLFQPNIIKSLFEIDEFQTSSTVMQRWIMANPTVRELYQAQGCDGFSDSYVDMHPNAIKESHYDYRRVMDGVIVDSEEESDEPWFVKHYADEILDDDKELDINDKVDIMITWERIENYLRTGKKDPTSPFNTDL